MTFRRGILVVGVCFAVVATGCGTGIRKPQLDEDIVAIDATELSRYWVDTVTDLQVSPLDEAEALPPCGYVEIEFLVDSNGEVFEERLVASEPPGVWDDWAMEVLLARRFAAAESNPGRVPVQVNQRTYFDHEDVDCGRRER